MTSTRWRRASAPGSAASTTDRRSWWRWTPPAGVVAISDAFFVYGNVEGDAWRPLGLNESFEETFRTNERVRRTADHIVPLYDPAVFDRYPGGIVAPAPG